MKLAVLLLAMFPLVVATLRGEEDASQIRKLQNYEMVRVSSTHGGAAGDDMSTKSGAMMTAAPVPGLPTSLPPTTAPVPDVTPPPVSSAPTKAPATKAPTSKAPTPVILPIITLPPSTKPPTKPPTEGPLVCPTKDSYQYQINPGAIACNTAAVCAGLSTKDGPLCCVHPFCVCGSIPASFSSTKCLV